MWAYTQGMGVLYIGKYGKCGLFQVISSDRSGIYPEKNWSKMVDPTKKLSAKSSLNFSSSILCISLPMRLVEAIFQYKITNLVKIYMKFGWFIVEIRNSIKFFSIFLLSLFILCQILGHFQKFKLIKFYH